MHYHSQLENALVAGIDFGGTNIEVGILDGEGRIVCSKSLPTSNFGQPGEFIEVLKDVLADMVPAGEGKLVGIGLGAPNGNYYTGSIEHAPNLNWKGIVPLARLCSEATGVPAVLTNDANAAAIGEAYFGGARGMQNFISVTIGTGLGCGIFVDGELIYGHSGFAGELGHTIVVPNGRLCTCGRNGCLEAYVSARGLIQNTREALQEQGYGSPLAQLDNGSLRPDAIFDAAIEGDLAALRAFETTGHYLGLSLANAAAILSPEAIFLFGGLMKAGDLLLRPTREYLDREILPILKGTVEVRTSSLTEKNAAVLGAGALAWSEIRKKNSNR